MKCPECENEKIVTEGDGIISSKFSNLILGVVYFKKKR